MLLQNYKISYIVRYHRKEKKLTQKELADLAGVGKTVIFDIEKGKESVSFCIVKKVLCALDINMFIQSPIIEEKIKIKL